MFGSAAISHQPLAISSFTPSPCALDANFRLGILAAGGLQLGQEARIYGLDPPSRADAAHHPALESGGSAAASRKLPAASRV